MYNSGFNNTNNNNKMQQAPASIGFLSSVNFSVADGKNNNKLLFNDIPGISVVFFFSDQCKPCHVAFPEYQRLSVAYGKNIRFTMANIAKSPEIIKMSNQTIMPIKFTPQIILYINKVPHARYDGQIKYESLMKFIENIMKHLKDNVVPSSGMRAEQKCEDGECGIPYNVVCDDDGMCYLTDGEITDGGNCENGECCFLTDGEL